MKKLLRNRGLVEREVLLKRGGFPSCFVSFLQEKHVFIAIGIFVRSIFTFAVINISVLSCGLLFTRK